MDEAEATYYGGWPGANSAATGFFRVEKIGGRWWFVTPAGSVFLSTGVNHVDYMEDYSQAFARFAAARLRDWGFNTIGWTQESMKPFVPGKVVHSRGWKYEQYRMAAMPYMHLLRFTDMEWYVEPQFPDVFSKEFEEKCDAVAREDCAEMAEDPDLIGYFYSDAPNLPLWAEQCGPEKFPTVMRRYYETIARAIRRYDKNHLLLGDRYKADPMISAQGGARVSGAVDAALDAMKETVDVFSTEYYCPGDEMEANLESWHAKTGKPILLADYAFHAPTDALEVGPGNPNYVPDQRMRGKRYKAFCRRAFANPLVIGAHWCAFGRSPGRRSGLLDGDDKPYEECVRRMRAFNVGELYSVATGTTENSDAE